MAEELRCPGRIHAMFIEEFDESGKRRLLLEVKCRSASCGARSGVIVFHYFDNETHDLVRTTTYKEPAEMIKKQKEGAR